MNESKNAPDARVKILRFLMILWMIAVLFVYWVAQGSPGLPFIADLTAPIRDFIQQFFSAPHLG